jgi:hypothetical protein
MMEVDIHFHFDFLQQGKVNILDCCLVPSIGNSNLRRNILAAKIPSCNYKWKEGIGM